MLRIFINKLVNRDKIITAINLYLFKAKNKNIIQLMRLLAVEILG